MTATHHQDPSPELQSSAPGSSDGSRVPRQPAAPEAVDALSERVFEAALGAIDLFSVYLGDRLGCYRAMADGTPVTPADLAARCDIAERYAREWLEQQATSGLVTAVTQDGEQRFRLEPAAVEVFTDRTSLNFLAPLARMLGAAAGQLPALLEAYRSGGGISWEQFGVDARESQAEMNRPWFEQRLAGALAEVDSLHTLLARPGARIADVGFGFGWSSIALARAYPEATVDGFDVDEASVLAARGNASAAGLADRVRFSLANAAALPEAAYDVVFAFECLHDMPQPVEVLAAARRALRPGGLVVVMDEAVGEALSAPGNEVDRLMYGFSLLVCLPDGLSHPPSVGTGTVMRRSVLTNYATEGGFAAVDVLPIDDFSFFRFYALHP